MYEWTDHIYLCTCVRLYVKLRLFFLTIEYIISIYIYIYNIYIYIQYTRKLHESRILLGKVRWTHQVLVIARTSFQDMWIKDRIFQIYTSLYCFNNIHRDFHYRKILFEITIVATLYLLQLQLTAYDYRTLFFGHLNITMYNINAAQFIAEYPNI